MTATDTTTPVSQAPSGLRTTLGVNAIFSGCSAAVMLIFSSGLAAWLEIPREVQVGAGLGLALFAGFVAWVAMRHAGSPGLVGFIAVADFSWVLGAVVIVLIPDALPAGGKIALALATLVVLDLGLLEWRGFRRLRTA